VKGSGSRKLWDLYWYLYTTLFEHLNLSIVRRRHSEVSSQVPVDRGSQLPLQLLLLLLTADC
jgi:hypothetical protein